MKFCVVLALSFATVSAGPKEDFVATFNAIVSNYLGANTPKAVDMVAQDAIALKDMDNITSHLAKEAIGLVPAGKAIAAMGMLTTYQSCMKNAGSTVDRAIAVVGAAFKSKLQPLLTKVQNKVKTMKANNKAAAEILDQVYIIANADINKPLIQSIINTVMTKVTKPEYTCATPPLNTVMPTSQYNMVYDAARG